MDRIGSDVRRELSRFGPVEGSIVEIVRAWPAAVGDTVARSAWPARLAQDGTLHVNAVSSTWAFELGRLAETILEQLRRELGEATPPALRFAPGLVPEPEADASDRLPETPEIAAKHRDEAARIAAGIEDEELRELVARAAAASLSQASADPAADRRF